MCLLLQAIATYDRPLVSLVGILSSDNWKGRVCRGIRGLAAARLSGGGRRFCSRHDAVLAARLRAGALGLCIRHDAVLATGIEEGWYAKTLDFRWTNDDEASSDNKWRRNPALQSAN